MPFMECKLCDKSFSGPEPYAQHLICKPHLEKVAQEGIDKSQLLEHDAVSSNQYKCELCDLELSGPVPLEQHYNGSKHKSMLNKKRIMDEQGAKNSNEESVISLNCSVCSKSFSGPESYEDHINSKKHQRKVEVQEMKARMTAQEPASCPPPVDYVQTEEDVQHIPTPKDKNLYPALPQEKPSVVPVRAHAKEMQYRKKKQPVGCFTGLRDSFRKKNKKQK